MKRSTKTVLLILAAGIFLISSSMILRQTLHYRAAKKAQASALEAAGFQQPQVPLEEISKPGLLLLPDEQVPLQVEPEQTPQPETESVSGSQEQTQAPLEDEARFLRLMNLPALQKSNEDVLGWIAIPGTPITYPLVQGEDNSHYLQTSWDGSYNSAGSIFLECENAADFSDFHTLIYGHHMRDGSMFTPLVTYNEQSRYENGSKIYIATEDGVRRYEIFSAYQANTKEQTYRLGFETQEDRQAFLDFCMEKSVIETQTVPAADGQILTLSTCTGLGIRNVRWVVHAVLTGVFPN